MCDFLIPGLILGGLAFAAMGGMGCQQPCKPVCQAVQYVRPCGSCGYAGAQYQYPVYGRSSYAGPSAGYGVQYQPMYGSYGYSGYGGYGGAGAGVQVGSVGVGVGAGGW